LSALRCSNMVLKLTMTSGVGSTLGQGRASFRDAAFAREPGIRNPGQRIWIPDSPRRGDPE
jgi:hypothetical protein